MAKPVSSKAWLGFLLFIVILLCNQTLSLTTPQCSHDKLVSALMEIRTCKAAHKWSSDFCNIHQQIQQCFTQSFARCFSGPDVQKLVRNARIDLRVKMEKDWGGRIPPQELEPLFDSCAFIASKPDTSSEAANWLDYVQTDNNCQGEERVEIKTMLSRTLASNQSVPDCLSKREVEFLKEEGQEQKKSKMKEGNPQPLQSRSGMAMMNTSTVVVFVICIVRATL